MTQGENVNPCPRKKTKKECWTQTQLSGWGGLALKEKIKRLKERLKSCNKEQFGDTFKRVQQLEAKLNKLESEAADRHMTPQEITIRKRLQQDLWGGGTDQKKIAWVKWDTICLPKQKGGLEIKDISLFNKALLGKWWWNLMQQNSEIWAKILDSKYGGWRALAEGKRAPKASIWWKDLQLMIHEQKMNTVLQTETELKLVLFCFLP